MQTAADFGEEIKLKFTCSKVWSLIKKVLDLRHVGIMVLTFSSMRAAQKIVNTISCRVFDTFFTKLTSTMHYGTEMNASQFGVKRSKVKVMVE